MVSLKCLESELNILTGYLAANYEECKPKNFYRDLFPVGEFQEKGVFEQGKYNGIIVEVTNDISKNGKNKVFRHTLTDDLEKLDEVIARDNFCLMSPISYIGKSRKSENARIMYALTIDLDGLKVTKRNKLYGITTLFHQIYDIDRIPNPTYVISSGTGLHLYYVFKTPIMLFPNVIKKLQKYKKELTRIVWQDDITELSYNVQYESLFQGFRVVGTITKKGERTRAFKTGNKVDIEYLNSFVDEEFKIKDIAYKSTLTLQEAKEKYPEWYEKRIVKKEPKGTWTTKRDLYDWWKSRILKEAKTGHRYYCLMCLAIYARKAGVEIEELEKDAFEIGAKFAKIPHSPENPFTNRDILAALESYNDSYITYPINSISYVSGIAIKKNKRNFRNRDLHLKGARAIQEINIPNWREGNGRPKGSGTKEQAIKDFLKEHQEEKLSVSEIARRLNVSRPTVYKYLK